MRLVKPVKAVLSIAASGSFMLVLSGSAFAANTVVGNTTETVVQKSSTVVNGVEVTPKDPSDGVKVDVIEKQGVADPAKPAGESGASTQAVTTPVADGAVATAPVKVGAAVLPAATSEANLVTATAVMAPAEDDPTAMVGAAATLVAADKKPVETMLIGASMLAVQPTITSHPVVVEDLAASLPTAVAHHSTGNPPQPTQTGWLLGRLTAGLAGMVVTPVFAAPHFDGVPVPVEAMKLTILTWTLIGLVALAFGAWMRRGGYAHAARSDVAALFSTFATPLKMSYGLALVPCQSSFLMVSDNKILFSMVPNAYRKEEMR